MLDSLTLDLLRTLAASADEGSFSAAGRKLRRTQSVVSQAIANLEDQLGLRLFDRAGRYPKATPADIRLVEEAHSIMRGVDGFARLPATWPAALNPSCLSSLTPSFPSRI